MIKKIREIFNIPSKTKETTSKTRGSSEIKGTGGKVQLENGLIRGDYITERTYKEVK